MKKYLIVGIMLIQSFAIVSNAHQLEQLDQSKSCTTTQKKKMGEAVVKWFNAYHAEDLKSQLELFSPDFTLYHSVLFDSALKVEKYNATLPVDDPKRIKLPFANGLVNQANYVDTLILIAHLADQSAPGDQPARVVCLNDTTVIVDIDFDGYQVSRDPVSGCITHKARYTSKAVKTFIFDAKTGLINRHYVNFDPAISAQAKEDLKKMQSEAVIPVVAETCRTFKDLSDQYHKSANR